MNERSASQIDVGPCRDHKKYWITLLAAAIEKPSKLSMPRPRVDKYTF